MKEKYIPFNEQLSEISAQINQTRALLASLERQRGWMQMEKGKMLGKIKPIKNPIITGPYEDYA